LGPPHDISHGELSTLKLCAEAARAELSQAGDAESARRKAQIGLASGSNAERRLLAAARQAAAACLYIIENKE